MIAESWHWPRSELLAIPLRELPGWLHEIRWLAEQKQARGPEGVA